MENCTKLIIEQQTMCLVVKLKENEFRFVALQSKVTMVRVENWKTHWD